MIPASVSDYRLIARKRLPRQLFDYIDGGSYEETTMADNINAFDRYKLRQRVLTDVSNIQMGCELFDEQLSLPVGLSPVGLAGSFGRRGEVQAMKACESVGVPFCLSTVSICSMEEVAKQACKSFWYQLYMIRERQVVSNLLNRAKAVGCKTLVMTVDLPFPGARYRDTRNGLSGNQSIPTRIKRLLDILSHPRWVLDVALKGSPLTFGNLVDEVEQANSLDEFQGWISDQFDPTVTWEDLAWVRDHWDGKLILKGVMDAEDAYQGMIVGIDGLIVSNHGGRQLDSVPASLDALPSILAAAGDKIPVIVDGGIRSGLDVLKAKALGASACMLGRPWAYALAAGGQQAIEHMLEIIKDELRIGMALTGKSKLDDVSKDIFVD